MLTHLLSSLRRPRSGVPALQPLPGPHPRYPGQLFVTLVQDKLGYFAAMARCGDVSETWVGPQRIVLLNHPEDIRRVLVTEQRKFSKGRAIERTKLLLGEGLLTNEGPSHLRQRRLVQPGLHRERLAGYARVMTDYTARALDRWSDGALVDLHEEMMHLTLTIAGRTFFDVDVEEAREVAEALDLSLRLFRYSVLPFGTLLEYAPVPWIRQLHRARRQVNALIARMIAERRRDGGDRGDLLSMLLAAQDTEGDDQGMSDRQLRDEIVTLLLAGHETTANALTWTCYLLAQHPEVAARLEAEVDAVVGARTPSAEDVPRLLYTRDVIAEGMRLFPPAWIVERYTREDFEAGSYRIPAGTIVYTSQYLVHRDPRWWPAPNRFVPERWADGPAAATRPKFAYFPFGGGTRICVGEHFAWLEATLVLAAIVQRWRMTHEDPLPPEPEALVTLRPRGGLRLRLERRSRLSARGSA
jgi:cytochrome P450